MRDAGSVIEEIDEDDEVYVAHHDVAEDGLTVTLTMALAEVSDHSETDLIPEFPEHVDPDALDRLFRPRSDGKARKGGPLHLSIRGYDVTIFSSGRIEIRP